MRQRFQGRFRPLALNTLMRSATNRFAPAPQAVRPRLSREDVLDGREVAELLHVPVSSVLDYARRGVLPGRKLGRRWIFLRDELENTVRAAPRSEDLLPAAASARSVADNKRPKRYPRAVPSAPLSDQTSLRL